MLEAEGSFLQQPESSLTTPGDTYPGPLLSSFSRFHPPVQAGCSIAVGGPAGEGLESALRAHAELEVRKQKRLWVKEVLDYREGGEYMP